MTNKANPTGEQFADQHPKISNYFDVMYKGKKKSVWYEHGTFWMSDHKRSGCLMTECITEVFA